MPGQPTGQVTAGSTAASSGAGVANAQALAAGVAALLAILPVSGLTAAQFAKEADTFARGYARVQAAKGVPYATAYHAAYSAAYAQIADAAGQAQADFAAGYYPHVTQPGAVVEFVTDGKLESDVIVQFDVPSQGRQAPGGKAGGAGAAGIPPPPLLNQTAALSDSPSTNVTLADQVASLPARPKPAAGVPRPLGQQMRRVR